MVGLKFVNGRAGDTNGGSGGCLIMGEDASVHLRNITFQNCSAPGMSLCGGGRRVEEPEREKKRKRE